MLSVVEIDSPEPKDDEVLVRVRAAGLNRGDWHMMAGVPYVVRIMGFGFRRPKQRIIGQDLAGVVERIGKDVTRWQPGDEVFGWGKGVCAELACVPETQLQPRPDALTHEEAAAVPVPAFTALHALRDQARLQPSQTVLIVGASGGVGTFAVQMAKAEGAVVTGVCSAKNRELVLSLGADHVIDYTTEDFAAAGPRFDVVVRVTGDRSVADCRRALKPDGTLVIVGGGRPTRLLGGIGGMLGVLLLNLFTRQTLRQFVSMADADDLAALADRIGAQGLKPVLDRRFDLSEAVDAMRYVESGRVRGRIVLRV